MKKIGTIITKCNECNHFKMFTNETHFAIAVCVYNKPFVLNVATWNKFDSCDIGTYNIPENCTLETYNS